MYSWVGRLFVFSSLSGSVPFVTRDVVKFLLWNSSINSSIFGHKDHGTKKARSHINRALWNRSPCMRTANDIGCTEKQYWGLCCR